MKVSRIVGAALLTAWLSLGAWGDVYVKNKPFKGNVSGTGGAVMVEAEPMLKLLNVSDYKLEGGRLVLGEKALEAESGMVSLKALTEALGVKMVVNSSLGTVDVYQDTAKQAEVASSDKPKPAANANANAAWGASTWHTTWEAASAEAKRRNKPILINFTGSDWCGWCIRLKKEVFDTDAFRSWAAQKVVLLEVDFPKGKPLPPAVQMKNQELAQKFGVTGYPSIFFSNAKGEALGPRFGYAEGGPEAWTKQAEQIMKGR